MFRVFIYRYTFNDDNLPEWFINDERKHSRPHLPVTKAQIQEYKARQKAIDARPIKKMAEAKARKKQKVISNTNNQNTHPMSLLL